MVQSNHATRGVTASYPQGEGIPNIVLIGVPDVAALSRVREKLAANALPHYVWIEPDNDLGFTAIATIALTVEQKKVLSSYRLYKFERGRTESTRMPCAGDRDSLTTGRVGRESDKVLE
jgi:hypothetical protein